MTIVCPLALAVPASRKVAVTPCDEWIKNRIAAQRHKRSTNKEAKTFPDEENVGLHDVRLNAQSLAKPHPAAGAGQVSGALLRCCSARVTQIADTPSASSPSAAH